MEAKADIIADLRRQILLNQGFKPGTGSKQTLGLGPIADAFPNGVFPSGTVHEFLCATSESKAATSGFVCSILPNLMHTDRVCIWISAARKIFPPALVSYGIDPGQVIFIEVGNEKEMLWVGEAALKSEGVTAVITEVRDFSFTASRRLQLAVEQSGVTAFILRINPRGINITASVARWQITPEPSLKNDGLPGVGFPCWRVSLLKVRNGKTGNWQVEWSNAGFRFIKESDVEVREQHRKVV